MDQIRPIRQEVVDKGSLIKSTTKQYIWEFYLGQEFISISLDVNYFTQKKKVIVNGIKKYEGTV